MHMRVCAHRPNNFVTTIVCLLFSYFFNSVIFRVNFCSDVLKLVRKNFSFILFPYFKARIDLYAKVTFFHAATFSHAKLREKSEKSEKKDYCFDKS